MLHKLENIVTGIVGFLLITLVVLACTLRMHVSGSALPDAAAPFDSGWTDAGERYIELNSTHTSLGEAGSTVSFYQALNGDALHGESLCFMTTNVTFSIYLGADMIYDFHPEMGDIYGTNYGDYIHTVRLPAFSGEQTLRIEGTVLRDAKWTGFHDMILQDEAAYLSGILRANMWKFVICLCCFVFGLIMFLFCLVEGRLHGDATEALCLSVITMVMSLWSSAQTRILLLITGNSSVLRVVDYAVLALLPIPFLIFVRLFTRSRHYLIPYIGVGLSCVNVAVQLVGVSLGWFDYSQGLIVSHVLILGGLAVITHMIVEALRKKQIDRSQSTYLISALAVICITGMVDMFRYYVGNFIDSSAATRIGLALFAGILAVYEFRQLVSVRIKSREAEVMQRLAMEDSLTGIYNRTAFTAFEKRLRAREEGICLFVHFDVNFLKKVNDTYGHAEGDRHIIAAARVLQKSFGEKGSCFRVGGDEFFVVLDGKGCQADFAAGMETFRRSVSAYNEAEKPPVPLVIAHGMAEYDCASHNPEAAERLADSRMYENKKQLKTQTA